MVTTASTTINTPALCKSECLDVNSLCTAYDFVGITGSCRIYKMGIIEIFGSTNSAEGTCHIIPVDPVNMEGACVLSTGAAIDEIQI